MGFENPRRHVIPFFQSPYDQVVGTSLNKNATEKASQRFDVKRPIVAIKIAADSQVDVCDLWVDGEFEVGDGAADVGMEAVSKNRIRVSAEAPFIGRIEPKDVTKLYAVPVRQYSSSSTINEGGTVIYPDETRATQYPVLKLEIFECACKGACDGHHPPLPTKLAPCIMLEQVNAIGVAATRSFRIPTCGREAVSISFALSGGGVSMDYEIKGVDYSARRAAGGTVDDIEKVLTSALAQPAGDYLFSYQGISFDEIRLLVTGVAAGNIIVKMEAK